MLDKDSRIGVISTTCLQVPPEDYGGLELMVYNLSHELGRRGYDTTCIAPEGSEIENVDVIETLPPDDSQDCFDREPDAYSAYAEHMPKFDLLIDHSWIKLSYFGKRDHPEVMADTEIMGVWHGMPAPIENTPVDTPNYVSVSKAAAEAWTWNTEFEVRHVYNGIDTSRYPLQEEKGEYYMTLNRITAEKGILECVQLADDLEIPFKVVGEDEFIDDIEYAYEVMKSCSRSDYAEYVGKVDQEEKVELLKSARGLVLLPQPPYLEVFGLAAVEAMACGTAVIATQNNGLAEVVETVQGTGAYENMDQIRSRVRELTDDRGAFPGPVELREGVAENFSKEAMTDIYLQRGEEAMREGW